MIEILRNIEETGDDLQYVSINRQEVAKFASTIREKDLQVSEISLSHYKWDKNQLVDLVFAFNSINFCFWAEKDQPKWAIDLNGEKLDGSTALFRALEEELKENPNFTNGDFLASLDTTKLARILKGNIEIPLFKERLSNLSEIGQILETRYSGSFSNAVGACMGNSVKLTSIVISEFPSFSDEEMYRGKSIPFYKRAQLNTKMISDTLVSYGEKPLDNLDHLTAFADYKIPQLLRSFKVLEYDSGLASRIDGLTIIEQGSVEEVEIRIATILAVEKIRQQLLPRFSWVTASHVDSMLWNKSQDKGVEVKPYHRTYTTAY